MNYFKACLISAFHLFLFSSFIYAAFPTPSVPGDGSFGSNNPNSFMGIPRTTTEYSKPYPTNKWFSSAYTNHAYHTFSFSLYPSPIFFAYNRAPVYNGMGTASNEGLVIGAPSFQFQSINQPNDIYELSQGNSLSLLISGRMTRDNGNKGVGIGTATFMKSYSDWAATTVFVNKFDPTETITTTLGKGLPFIYNHYAPGIEYASIGPASSYILPVGFFNAAGTHLVNNTTFVSDRIMMFIVKGGVSQYYGIYAPPGSTLRTIGTSLLIYFPASAVEEKDRYLSIALLMYEATEDYGSMFNEAFERFNEYYKYAYNFILEEPMGTTGISSGTSVSWQYNTDSSITTTYNFEFDVKRTGSPFIENQTIFGVFPHQWKNMTTSPNTNYTYKTLRGLMKVHTGKSFTTKHEFHGILPTLTYEIGNQSGKLQNYINDDKEFNLSLASGYDNVYRNGKMVAKAANLIPIFHQAGNYAARDAMIARLKAKLESWYVANSKYYFWYDNLWGGIIAYPFRTQISGNQYDEFKSEYFNDHNFHYGYFVYASAILAMYDEDFKNRYRGIIDLLVKDYANSDRNDMSFPFLRGFDVYEGHSWANGLGGADNSGNDQESISEAMNGWAAMYLWGVATNNQEFINTAIYGYTTEYEAAKEYYFDMSGDTYRDTGYEYRGGIIYENSIRYFTHWGAGVLRGNANETMGIWLFPLTPSMLYMGYDVQYAESFYNMFLSASRKHTDPNYWKDLWLRFRAMSNGGAALSEWDSLDTIHSDEGSSLTYSYQFINFFNSLGVVNTDYFGVDIYGKSVPFTMMKKGNDYTFIAYNNSHAEEKEIRFYPRQGASASPNGGIMRVPPRTLSQTQDFKSFRYDLREFPVVNQSNSSDRPVYSLYSDSYSFVGDNIALDSWDDSITIASHTSSAGAFEGENYLSMIRNTTWGGWGFRFADSSIDMSPYYDGRIKFSIRIDAPSADVANYEVGFETGKAKVFFTLAELGFDSNSTQWQTLSIPLKFQFHKYITPDSLKYTTLPFMMNQNAGSTPVKIYIDSVLWKKSNMETEFAARVKNRHDNELNNIITWPQSSLGFNNMIASQYIELELISLGGNNSWGIQMYTDNKSYSTYSDPEFTGTITSNTVSGLVNSAYTDRDMLPLRWMASDSIITSQSDFMLTEPMFWSGMRDISAFDFGTGLYYGADEVRIMDTRGYKINSISFADIPIDRKIRIYFVSDFFEAKKIGYYRSTFFIEYFVE